MADSMRMAFAEPGCKRGQGGGPLGYQLVPAAAKGPRHPQGRSEAEQRRRRLTGNGAVGGSQRGKRSPSAYSNVFDVDRQRVVLLWVSRPKGEPDQWLRV